MSEKLLKWIIYVAGIVCIYVFIAIRSVPLMNAILVEKMIPEHFDFVKYGELYYFNYISHFKKMLPPAEPKYRFSEKHPDVSEAGILMFGDSFLDISRQATLPERINDSLGQRVFYHRFLNPHHSNPLCILKDYDYQKGEPHTVIYESVERNIHFRFDEPFEVGSCADDQGKGLSATADVVLDLTFPTNSEEMYKQVLKRSVFTTNAFGFFATLKFDFFGYISSQTPVYKAEGDPWLFYAPQVNEEAGSFYYTYSDEEINTYCDHIALMRDRLKQTYNLDMIFLPVPSKYTICHGVVNDDPYNDFLPKLYDGLDKRGVTFVDLYHTYSQHGEELYYGTDTHWNELGVDIALDKVVEKINLKNLN